jgi:hypothetical protein
LKIIRNVMIIQISCDTIKKIHNFAEKQTKKLNDTYRQSIRITQFAPQNIF